MIGKILTVAVLASLAVTIQGHSFHGPSYIQNANAVPVKEGRLIEIPSLGALILKGAKLGFFLLKSVWSVVGLKLGAIALVANLVIWGLKHSFSIILGGIGMFGFCKLTGKCSLNHISKPVLEIGDTLLYAARQLQNGANLYDNEIPY